MKVFRKVNKDKIDSVMNAKASVSYASCYSDCPKCRFSDG